LTDRQSAKISYNIQPSLAHMFVRHGNMLTLVCFRWQRYMHGVWDDLVPNGTWIRYAWNVTRNS